MKQGKIGATLFKRGQATLGLPTRSRFRQVRFALHWYAKNDSTSIWGYDESKWV